MKVKKKSGRIQPFNKEKIEVAILKASEKIDANMPKYLIERIANYVEGELTENDKNIFTTDEISKIVEDRLMNSSYKEVARCYIQFRHDMELIRNSNTTDTSILELISGENEEWNKENSNKDAKLVTTQRDYIAGIVGRDIAKRFIIPDDVLEAFDEGAIYVHDTDYLAEHTRTNCCLINLQDMLQNGTVLNGCKINKPHRILTATTIATQILTAVSSAQYGGVTISLSHLAPFIEESRKRYRQKYEQFGLDERLLDMLVEADVTKEITDSVQTFNYQVNSMSSTNGQSPFLSVWMYLGEVNDDALRDDLALLIAEFLRQRAEGMENEHGAMVTVAFPKLILCLDKYIMDPKSKYHYIKRLASDCTSKRLVPDYVSEKVMKEEKINKFGKGDVYPPMGCRSFLHPDYIKAGNISKAKDYDPDTGKYYGRFNIGVTSLNLPYIALEAKEMYESGEGKSLEPLFFKRLKHYAELSHKMQRVRAERLMKTKAEVAPIMWQAGAVARLNADDYLEPLIKNKYCSSSIGYMGLYEAVKVLTGENHWENSDLAKKILTKLNAWCAKWTEKEGVYYSLYGTPGESLTDKFATAIKKRFGDKVFEELDGHDRNFVTNSVHVPVWIEIDPFSKLEAEAPLQKLSPGGNIIYIETEDMTKNLEAIEQVMDFIYEQCMYSEINTETSFCAKCGGYNTVIIDGDRNDYHPICSHCGNEDDKTLSSAVRVCGYISTHSFNRGRGQDIHDRYKHLSDKII